MQKSLKFLIIFIILFLSKNCLHTEDPLTPPSSAKQHILSICAIFKDEATYFKEWIEFHLLVGVEHFYLYNNGSMDNFIEVLDPYINKGFVTLIDWPDGLTNHADGKVYSWVMHTQIPAYEHACKVSTPGKTKWLALIDIDEFLVPKKVNTVTEILAKHDDVPGISILWHTFGTSHVKNLAPKTLLIETLHMTCNPSHSLNNQVIKTILKPETYAGFSWPPHKCIFKNNQNDFEMKKDEIQINHYVNRTLDYFYASKVKKKESMNNKKMNEEEIDIWLNMGNEVEDQERAIHRFVPELRKRMGW